MFKRVLVPLDRSALSERVLPIAKGLARSFGSRIDLVYVVPTLTEDIPEEFIAQASEEAEAYLKGIHDAFVRGAWGRANRAQRAEGLPGLGDYRTGRITG